MKRVTLDPAELVELPGNENVMEPELFQSLVRFVRERGFKQPILVRQLPDGRFGIVDGVHRRDAAVEAGLGQVPCEVDAGIATDADAKAVRIGMNRHRGDLDLAAVGRTMLELSAAGWSPADLTTVGYSEADVQALLESAAGGPDPDAITASVSAAGEDPGAGGADRTYTLKIEFTEEDDYRRALAALKKAGCGNLATGMMVVLGEE